MKIFGLLPPKKKLLPPNLPPKFIGSKRIFWNELESTKLNNQVFTIVYIIIWDDLEWGGIRLWRRERDSNPRYAFAYGTLAMCWFKPLTHPSEN